ncbi:peptidoglycan-binding protein [Kitasatospora sp. NPDC051170]|uniref:peptidoglycan-binding protein n=1 Tax=Kitasatospora sp. NPDC051170 TaxID=3364056 RepID=UPI0037BCC793
MLKRTFTKAGLVAASAVLLATGTTGTAHASPNAGYIGYGYANDRNGVWCVQHLLNLYANWIGDPDRISEDAAWGPQTYARVVWFQKKRDIQPADGIVGPQTGNVIVYSIDGTWGGQSGYCWKYIPTGW